MLERNQIRIAYTLFILIGWAMVIFGVYLVWGPTPAGWVLMVIGVLLVCTVVHDRDSKSGDDESKKLSGGKENNGHV